MDGFDFGDIDSGLDLTADSALGDLHHDCRDQSDSFSQSLIAAHVANGMTPHADFASPDTREIPQSIRQQLRKASPQRNLRTAAVLGIAVSGGLIHATWLAATAGGTFLALGTWRYKQLRHPVEAGHNRSGASSL